MIHFANNSDFLLAKASSKHIIVSTMDIIKNRYSIPMRELASGKAVLMLKRGRGGAIIPSIISEFARITGDMGQSGAHICDDCIAKSGVCHQLDEFMSVFELQIKIAMNEMLSQANHGETTREHIASSQKTQGRAYPDDAYHHAKNIGVILTGNRQSDVAIVKNGFNCSISAVHPDKTGFNSQEVGERISSITDSRDWLLRLLS